MRDTSGGVKKKALSTEDKQMTDIVERLRKFGGHDQRIWKVMDEGADEIERLRKRIEELEAIDILEKDLRTYNGY